MLRRRILVSGGMYISYSLKEEQAREYIKKAEEVFRVLREAIKKNNVYNLLEGPVAQKGFQRLT